MYGRVISGSLKKQTQNAVYLHKTCLAAAAIYPALEHTSHSPQMTSILPTLKTFLSECEFF